MARRQDVQDDDEGQDVNATPRLLGGRYEIGDLLGRGGMAEVHIGRDTRLGRTVAIKMLRSDLARDPSFQARFRREAQSAAALNHPAVVAVYDSGEDQSLIEGGAPAPYIVMEYVEGRTLRELVSVGRPMPWREALRVTSGVLAALAYSHRAGIVHRDIKPANVMVTPSGDIKVMDFGIARAIADSSATMTQTQAVIGTAQYLSPEQARGEQVDARSDLYSAGCLLFELLTGRPPFVADSPVAVAYQHVGEMPTAPGTHAPDVPEAVDAIVLHSLEKERGGRYQTADDFRDDVEAVLAGRRISSSALGVMSAAAATGAMSAATQAMGTVPGTSTTSTLPPAVPEADLISGGRGEGQDTPNRTGLWVLLGLLGAAIVAVAVLVLPGMLGANDAPKPQQVSVPDLSNKTVADATAALKSAGLTLGTREDKADDTVAQGEVISQDPASGSQVDAGSAVAIVVSTGPESVTVPDLVGKTRTQAKAALEAVGLQLGDETEVESTDQAKGHIVSSNPAPGDSVAKDSSVAIEVSSGKVAVPNVIGLTVSEATTKLTDAGLKVDATKYQESTQPEGTVIQQSYQGKTVNQGTTVTLVVAKAPSTPTPSPSETPTSTPTGTATLGGL